MGKVLRSATGFGLAFVAAMILLELFVRFSGTSSPTITLDDPSFGRLIRPNFNVVFLNEGFKIGKTNTYGYLGRGYPPEKPPGAVRIALMGDSYVAGNHLFDRHHFGTLMEERLNSLLDREVQVLNLGFPAVNFEQMYIYYQVFGKKFHPDLALYFIGTGSLNTPIDEVGPRLKLEGDSLGIDYSFRSSRRYARSRRLSLIRELALYPLVHKAREMHARGATPGIIFDKFYRLLAAGAGGELEEEPVEATQAEPIEDPGRAQINRAIVVELGKMNSEGATTSIIVVRDPLPAAFVKFAEQNGVLVLDPGPALERLARQGVNPRYWPGSHRSGHWNPYAHRAIADYLADRIAPLLQ
jgi:hypothetical protein